MKGAGSRRALARAGGIVALLLALIAGAWALGRTPTPPPVPPRAENQRPPLMLLTSLPLVFAEKFGLEGSGSPTLRALSRRYKVVTIPVADRASLQAGGLLLMAHASAQPAEALVDLDEWVRGGGRVLVLADPALDWHSELPLGSALRPSPMFPDTGLLGHWGLRLDAPDERGPAERTVEHRTVLTSSPGALFGKCQISKDRLVARCKIGRGEATIIADADFLDVDRMEGATGANLDALLAELAHLERK